jgi:hypothetical protein
LHFDRQEDLLLITADKVRLHLLEHLADVTKGRAWMPAVALFASFFVALVTAQFQDALYLEAATWRAAYLLARIIRR